MLNRTGCVLSIALILAGGMAGAADRTVLVEYFTSDT